MVAQDPYYFVARSFHWLLAYLPGFATPSAPFHEIRGLRPVSGWDRAYVNDYCNK